LSKEGHELSLIGSSFYPICSIAYPAKICRSIALNLEQVSLLSKTNVVPPEHVMALDVGDIAPDFTLSNQEEAPVSLADLRGQWVVLYFYPRDNTPGCTKEACGFRDRYADYQAQNVVVLGISPDTAKSHQKFIEKQALPFTLLCDPEAKVARTYDSYGPKKFMGKEYEGVYRQTFLVDPQGKVAQIYRKVKPAEHASQVLQDLESLQGNVKVSK
jgi:thioredoxin-dependent peroxiredoxin